MNAKKPKRIQLSRRKGYRKPTTAVVVARPTKWGNPYVLSAYKFQHADGSPAPFNEDAARDLAIRDFEGALVIGGILKFTAEDAQRELRGNNLACWCPPSKKCHADSLLEIANR